MTDLYRKHCEWGEFCSSNDRRDEERVEEESDKDEPKIVEKDKSDDIEGKCRSNETETFEVCAVKLRIGCGNNPSDESIFNGLCDDCRD